MSVTTTVDLDASEIIAVSIALTARGTIGKRVTNSIPFLLFEPVYLVTQVINETPEWNQFLRR